jgi:uncharacterized protein YfaS (alpha-2-macroglobulin family)
MGLTTLNGLGPLRRPSSLHRRARRASLVIPLGLLYALAVPARAASWKEVERLTGEQKLEAAAAEVGRLRAEAQKSGNDAEWARALIREVQLRTALHGYETAVRFLHDQPWPKSQPARTALLLYQASSLVTYNQAYAWEIGQRERIASPSPGDLKTWTTDQIYAAATAAYVEIWKGREALGAEKVERFAEYLVPNNYPRDIRGTLRDAVSYLFVELLANSQGWRPEQSNEVFALDLPALLKGSAGRGGTGAARGPRLDDPAVHPLVKAAAVLDDLEAWHLGRKELGAALETRLVRARTLFNHFTEEADRDAILADLASRLAANRNLAWWAMGQGVLAELEEQRGRLARAHDAAAAGAKTDGKTEGKTEEKNGTKADADSPGVQLCRALVGRLEAPSYQLESMQADGPRRRSVVVAHRNLPVLYLRAYRLDLDRRLASNADVQLVMQSDEAKRLLKAKPALEWNVPLPGTPDYKNHRTYVTPPLDQPGLYGIVASGRADFSTADNVLQSVTLLVTSLVTTRRQTESGQQEITVLDGNTGAPVAGAEVTLYQYDYEARGRTVESKRTTDADGIARLSLGTSRSRSYREYLAVARHGGQAAVDREPMQFWQAPTEADETSALVYTDRSIYRPLQKVLWKAVVFTGRRAQARLHTAAGHAVTISLVDPNGQVVDKRETKTNAYGSVAGELAIPAGRPLGSWSVTASVGGQASVRVEEYKRPTFETKLNDPAGGLRLNKPAALTGEARYYFGLPVTHGQVRWRVTREPVYPFWWGWFWPTPRGHAVQTIATGTAAVDSAGRFTLGFTPKADERAAASKGTGRGNGNDAASAVSFRYRVVADVTSEDGETRTAERAFRLGFVSVEAQLAAPTGFLRASQTNEVKATRTDLDGAPRAGQARWRLVSLAQPKTVVLPADEPLPAGAAPAGTPADGDVVTPGDRLRPRWDTGATREQIMRGWPDGATIATGEVTHDARGEASIALPSNLVPGAYRLRYETADDFGAKYQTQAEYLVVGSDAGRAAGSPIAALPAVLQVEAPSVPVGGTARVLATSGIPGQTLTLGVWRAGKQVLRRRLVAGRDPAVVELPVKSEDRGGFSVSLDVVRDHQHLALAGEVAVPWDDRELTVSFATFRDKIRPGAKETWKVTVKGPAGAKPEAAAAELLAYMYDRSLDLFAPHAPPSPMSLWPSGEGVPGAADSLGSQYGQWVESNGWHPPPNGPSLNVDRLKNEESYGVGGMGLSGVRTMRFHSPQGAPAMAMAPAPAAPMEAELAKRAAPEPEKKVAAMNASPRPEAVDKALDRASAAPPAAPALRSNFAETAFWRPQLLTGPDGAASLEFTVPDSVTSWNVWVHAVTKDLLSGSVHRQTNSVKDLMVRPNVPRFLREGDKAELKVVVNNASPGELSGEVRLAVVDPDGGRDLATEFGLATGDLARPFKVAKDGGANVTFTLAAPRQVRMAAFKVTATAGALSDGELRPLPVLPSRIHLVQSRFVTLRDKDRREMTFKDLAAPDPTRVNDQMVVTVEAQLFTTVLAALPYLITYPYECTEQTLNRFLSSAIVGSVFRDFPPLAKLGRELSAARDTPVEPFDATDPNRKMALEESPWLDAARGEPLDPKSSGVLRKVLDPKVAAAERAAALAKLEKMQLPSGAFPWFPGGPPDPYMTLYVAAGFARAAEFKVDVPKDLVQRAWKYLGDHFRAEHARKLMAEDCCWEWLTFLGYVASSYPDPTWVDGALGAEERAAMLAFSFKHWKQHAPLLKAYLALTLKRAGRAKDAKLVWASVMDSAKTRPDQGTFWAPEDRSWLWYNDTIETHAFALRTEMELEPPGTKKREVTDGLALWLLLNKKLNQWKSTRATAEVIYALVHYLKADKALGVREDARVSVGGKVTDMVFEPDQLAGRKNRIVIPGPEVGPRTASVSVEKSSKGFAFASAAWHFSTEKLPAEERGDFFQVSRAYFRRDSGGKEVTLSPLKDGAVLKPGDQLEVHLSLRSKHAAEYVHLRDPRGAGFEPENAVSQYHWDLGLAYYEEIRDSGTNFFFAELPAGEHNFKYRVRANMAGTFRVGPATVQSLYAPEFNAYSAGHVLKVASAP